MKLFQLIEFADFIEQVFGGCNFEFVDSYGITVSVQNINMYHINGERFVFNADMHIAIRFMGSSLMRSALLLSLLFSIMHSALSFLVCSQTYSSNLYQKDSHALLLS